MDLNEELEKFINHKHHFSKLENFLDLDTYGFSLSKQESVDVLVCGLTHGNETIGLEIINLILKEIKDKKPTLTFAFLLNNVDAYLSSQRYMDFDLNRSFLNRTEINKETLRAEKIENIILKLRPKIIIDLHQTVEPTYTSFVIIPENKKLIELSNIISMHFPIITFSDKGFSNRGSTLIEFCYQNNIPALVYEIGQMGFNFEKASEFKNIILNIKLTDLKEKNKTEIPYYFIHSLVPNQNNFKLKSGFKSFQKIQKFDILATNHLSQDFYSPIDGYVIFPRYKNIDPLDSELAYLVSLKK